MSGLGWGAVYGVAGGVLANLVLAAAATISMFLTEGDIATAFGLGLLLATIGSMVAAVLGAGVGAVFGLLLGAARIERHAPIVAAIVAAGFPLLTMVGSLADDFGGAEPGSAQLNVISAVAIVGFAAAGYVAGIGFTRSSSWVGGKGRPVEPARLPASYDTVIQPRDDLRPAVRWQQSGQGSPYLSSNPVNSRSTRP